MQTIQVENPTQSDNRANITQIIYFLLKLQQYSQSNPK